MDLGGSAPREKCPSDRILPFGSVGYSRFVGGLPVADNRGGLGASDYFQVEGHVEEWCDDTLESVDRTIALFLFGSADNSGLLDILRFVDGL
jgi:hypothetical protein